MYLGEITSETRMRGAKNSHEGKTRRACDDCGIVYEASLNSNSIRCKGCSSKHNKEHRTGQKRKKDREQTLQNDFVTRFDTASYEILMDPDKLFHPGAKFTADDMALDLKNCNYSDGTLVKSLAKKQVFIISGIDGSALDLVSIDTYFVFQTALVMRQKAKHELATNINIQKHIVFIYKTGYNMFCSKTVNLYRKEKKRCQQKLLRQIKPM